MKKLIILLITFLISISTVSASNNTKLENLLYKQVSVTNKQIERDYSKSMTNKIRDQFIMYRYKKDKVFLNKLDNALKKGIQRLNQKNILSINDRKKLNLYNNIYFRTKLLLEYNLK